MTKCCPPIATPVPTGSRYMVVAESVLTDAFSCPNSGGMFPTKMKRTGFDLLAMIFVWTTQFGLNCQI